MDASSCGRVTTHSLSADMKIASQGFLGSRQQLINWGAHPSPVAVNLEQLQAPPQPERETFEQRWTGELDAPGHDHQFNLRHG